MTDKAFDKYENIIFLGDINIDTKGDSGENVSFLAITVKHLL